MRIFNKSAKIHHVIRKYTDASEAGLGKTYFSVGILFKDWKCPSNAFLACVFVQTRFIRAL